jgi:hypothetical protein
MRSCFSEIDPPRPACVKKGRAAVAYAALADPLYEVDVGGSRDAGAGQGDVSSGSCQQMGLVVVT